MLSKNLLSKTLCCVFIFIFIFTFFIGCRQQETLPADVSHTPVASELYASEGGLGDIFDFTELLDSKPIFNNNLDELIAEYGLDEESAEWFDAPDDFEALPDTTQKKLRDSYEAGQLTEEDYSRLLILNQFNDDLIPDEYKAETGYESINYAFQYIADNWTGLSPETLEQVAPYMLPIKDPESYFRKEDLGDSVSTGFTFSLFRKVGAASPSKQLIINDFFIEGIKFSICYYEYDNWSDDKKLEYNMCVNDIESAINTAYEKFETLLTTRLTKNVIIELVPLSSHSNGCAWFQDNTYRIRLATANYRNAVQTMATSAHELFHNFQYEIGLRFTGTDMKWLHEATAKWSEHYVFDSFNTEHGYLEYFFRTLDRDLIDFGNCYEYSGYMLFYYFSDYGEYDIVPELLYNTVRNGGGSIRQYLSDSVSNMREQYAKYAIYNINMGICKHYFDYGNLVGRPVGKSYYKRILEVDEKDEQTVTLKPGGIQYYLYRFDSDTLLKHVDIEFENTFDDDEYIKREVIIRIDGLWYFEDWSAVEEENYCKLSEFENEKIEQILIIYSNSNFNKSNDEQVDSFKIKTAKCYSEMEVSIEAETIYTSEDFIWKSTASINDTVSIIEHSFYVIKSSDYSFNGSATMENKPVINSNGSSTASIPDPAIETSMARLLLPIDKRKESLKESLLAFGLTENTPKGGILITLPGLSEGEELQGSTEIYMPDPVGTISLDSPLPFDGISQLIAILIPSDKWNSNGFDFSTEVDYFSHECPLSDWFTVDFSQLQEMLSGMGTAGGQEIPSLEQQLADSGLSLSEFNALMENLPGSANSGTNTSNDPISAMQEMMTVSRDNPGGAVFIVKLTITGTYTKYYGE